MADIDTGLGWSAESDYLLQSGSIEVGKVGSFTWPEYPAVPLPVSGSTPYEVYQRGNLVAEAGNNQLYGSSDVPGCMFIRLEQQSGGMIRPEAYSPMKGKHCYLVVFNTLTQTLGNTTVITIGSSSYGTFSGIPWYGGTANSISFGTATFYISTQWPGSVITSISFTGDSITKPNAGYAVACNVRWKTQSGTVIYSPILISSESDFATMTGASGYNFAKFNGLKEGLQFYMGFWDITDKVVMSQLPVIDLSGSDAPYYTLQQLFKLIASPDYANIHVTRSPDPYTEETDPSQEEGGAGDELENDENGIDTTTPRPSGMSAGIYQIYTPSESELNSLSSYLWSTQFDVDQVKKLFSSPMESILGLSAVPVHIVGGTPRQLTIGGVTLTGVTMPPVLSEYRDIDMGTIFVKERWGSYLDYEPFTRFSIVLPYIGIKEISTDDIMGRSVHLYYNIEVVSGTVIARMEADGMCLYEWTGNCAMQLPITGRSFDTLVSTAVGIATTAVTGIATGNPALIGKSVASAAINATAMKPSVTRSGNVSGVSGFLGQQKPYLIRQTPNAYIPNEQNKYIGYPSYISVNLGSITGYNVIESIHLEDIPATDGEISELETILKSGVIF